MKVVCSDWIKVTFQAPDQAWKDLARNHVCLLMLIYNTTGTDVCLSRFQTEKKFRKACGGTGVSLPITKAGLLLLSSEAAAAAVEVAASSSSSEEALTKRHGWPKERQKRTRHLRHNISVLEECIDYFFKQKILYRCFFPLLCEFFLYSEPPPEYRVHVLPVSLLQLWPLLQDEFELLL